MFESWRFGDLDLLEVCAVGHGWTGDLSKCSLHLHEITIPFSAGKKHSLHIIPISNSISLYGFPISPVSKNYTSALFLATPHFSLHVGLSQSISIQIWIFRNECLEALLVCLCYLDEARFTLCATLG